MNQTLSGPVSMISGVPKDFVFEPEIFMLELNDLAVVLQSDCIVYADDLNL